MKKHIKPIEKQKQIKLICNPKFKTSSLVVKNNTNSVKRHLNQINVVYKFICPFRECLPKNKDNSHNGYTTTLSRRLTQHLSEKSAIKQNLSIKHNTSTNPLTSDVRKILSDKTIFMHKNNNEKRLPILKVICIKKT